jgi:hypothetical protein
MLQRSDYQQNPAYLFDMTHNLVKDLRLSSRQPIVMDSPDEAPYFCMADTRCRLCQFELEEDDLVIARLLVRSV